MTTGHLLTAVLADAQSQGSKALGALGVAQEPLANALAQVAILSTSDAVPGHGVIEIKVGEVTTTIQDPGLATALKELTPDQIRVALNQAFRAGPGHEAVG